MNNERIKLLADTLRSGKYKQGLNRLWVPGEGHCCWGVACDLHAAETATAWEVEGRYAYYLGERSTPSDVIIAWMGLDEVEVNISLLPERFSVMRNPTYQYDVTDVSNAMINGNDHGLSFIDIADFLDGILDGSIPVITPQEA